MAIATRIDSTLNSNWTQATLFDAVKLALANAGYSAPVSDFTSGTDRIAVYSIVLDGAKTYGTSFLRVRVSNAFVVGTQLLATWNPATNTGTGGGTEIVNTALVTTTTVNFVALNGGSEYKLVLVYQNAIYFPVGFLSPANKPVWWDLNSFNYCFIPAAITFALLRGTTLSPYANSELDSTLNNARMGIANTITNRRDVLPGVVLFTQANQGIAGRTSDDLIMLAASGTTRLDTIQIPSDTKQYLVINPAVGGLCIRTV
jgi:hypothetical protein